ncbi:PREDICTED: 40S ribosomal protein S8-1-like [Camelina sativa]|uniref:40S ribosomal protein S8-1-like n=1 Tax=Camelina sativa TaxID=90675 RepID=A0ABM0Y4W1_CAMSA|nr:PREDICTED: 40S ribosomal protein S8-1-like [Camelina sativa]
MGISCDKMRATGGKQKQCRKKQKYEMGRHPANANLSNNNKTVKRIRVPDRNVKYAWGSEAVTHNTRILDDVVYNASNTELVVGTKTLVKSVIYMFFRWMLLLLSPEL